MASDKSLAAEIEAGIARGETMIFLGYDADEMARFYCV